MVTISPVFFVAFVGCLICTHTVAQNCEDDDAGLAAVASAQGVTSCAFTGLCEIAEMALLKTYCPKTCGECATPTPAAITCEDDDAGLAAVASAQGVTSCAFTGLCEIAEMALLKTYCPKTCGECATPTPAAITCEDDDAGLAAVASAQGVTSCAFTGLCENAQMAPLKAYCPRTCGECGDGGSAAPPPTPPVVYADPLADERAALIAAAAAVSDWGTRVAPWPVDNATADICDGGQTGLGSWAGVICAEVPGLGLKVVAVALGEITDTGANGAKLVGDLEAFVCDGLCRLPFLAQLLLPDNFNGGTLPTCLLSGCFKPFPGVGHIVTHLDFSGSQLSGPLPEFSASTGPSSLQSVLLNANALTGTLPDSWAEMPALTHVSATRNQFTGELPVTWAALSTLQSLNLDENFGLTGALPSEWSSLRALTALRVGFGSKLTGTLPESFHALRNLTELFLTDNLFTGTLPASWGQLTAMTYLSLSGLNTEGTLPEEWGAMTELDEVHVFGCNFTGTLPASWGGMTKLRRMLLQQNSLTGSFPASWSGLRSVLTFASNQNQLTGTLPPEFAALSDMQEFIAWENRLTGTLPPEWEALSSLKLMLIMSNLFTGTVPEEWGRLPVLTELLLGHNRLIGTLPASLQQLTDLQALDLQNNALTGSIPAGLSALTALTLMDLNTNQLNSTLPPDLAGLRALRELYVDNNLLQGPLPESLLSLQQTWYAPEKRLMSSFDFPERQDVVDTPIRSPLYSEVLPSLRSLKLSNNPLNISANDMLRSFACLQQLQTLKASQCGLMGSMGEAFDEMFVEFSEIPLDADAKEVEVQRVSPFPSLTTLELNDNSIEELYYNIPEGVTSVNLARNQLVGPFMDHATSVVLVLMDQNPIDSVAHALPATLGVDPRNLDAYPALNLVCRKVTGLGLFVFDPHYDGYQRCACTAGYGSEEGPGKCDKCRPNTFRPQTFEQLTCYPCPPNTRTAVGLTGAATELECLPEPGYQYILSSQTIEACPVGTTKDTLGLEPCAVCPVGTYAVNTTACAPCPGLAQCQDGILTIPLDRWRRNTEELTVYKCTPGRCLGEEADATQPGCAEGHTGALCATCSAGYGFALSKCVNCDGSTTGIGIALAVLIVGLAAYSLFSMILSPLIHARMLSGSAEDKALQEDAEHAAATANLMALVDMFTNMRRVVMKWQKYFTFGLASGVKVLLTEIPDWIQDNALKGDNVYSIATDISIEVINYMQIVATVSAFYDVTWPDSLTGLFGICEVAALSFSSIPFVGCLFSGMDVYKGFMLWCFVPLGIGASMVALYWGADILAAHNAKTARLFRASITKAGCLLCIVGYIPLSQNVFSVLLCTELYGKYYLSASLGSQCYVGEHNAYFAMGIIFVVVYCVGIPLGYVLACRSMGVPALVAEKRRRTIFHRIAMNFISKEIGGIPAAPELHTYALKDVRMMHKAILQDKTAEYVMQSLSLHDAMALQSMADTAPVQAWDESSSPKAVQTISGTASPAESASVESGQDDVNSTMLESLQKVAQRRRSSAGAGMQHMARAAVKAVGQMDAADTRVTVDDVSDKSVEELVSAMVNVAELKVASVVDGVTLHWSTSERVDDANLAEYQLKERMTLMSASDLFASYKPEFWYWESVETVRALILGVVIQFVEPGTSLQLVVVTLLCMLFLVLYILFQPMASALSMKLRTAFLLLTVYNTYVALGLNTGSMSSAVWTDLMLVLNILVITLPLGMAMFLVALTIFSKRKVRKHISVHGSVHKSQVQLGI